MRVDTVRHSIVERLGIQMTKHLRLNKVCDKIRYDGVLEGRLATMWLEIIPLMLSALWI
jgi:hypothetical protein